MEGIKVLYEYDSKSYFVGSEHKPKNSEAKAKILGKVDETYKGSARYVLEFMDEHKSKIIVEASNIKKGVFKNPYAPNLYNKGFIGDGKYKSKINGKMTKYYDLWTAMMRRVYSDSLHKKYPSYVGVKLCEEWHNFQVFAEWCENNYPSYPTHDNNGKDLNWHLDKDVLSDYNNKIYSPETCIFLPGIINTYINKDVKTNTSGYRGVDYVKKSKKYRARLKLFNKDETANIGFFEDAKSASLAFESAYKIEIEEVLHYLKELEFKEEVIEIIRRKL